MEKSQDAKAKDSATKTERSDPLPLADRRRLLRPTAKTTKPDHIFTDWASI